MHNKSLTALFGDKAKLGFPLDNLDSAIKKYGELRTFFSKYRNPIGIELEIENVDSDFVYKMEDSIYWVNHEDNSLKHRGMEFVSHPIHGQNIDYAIHEFNIKSIGEDFEYSVRTSTHVHVNVSFMMYEELLSLILLSAYVEPLLYTLCSPDRKGNPYCYSITLLAPQDVLMFNEDMKYCGINLAPIPKQLTVEYRQLHGTRDFRLIRRWVQLLCKLQYFAKTVPHKEVKMLLRDAIRTRSHGNLLKRIWGASLTLFPMFDPVNDNLLWIVSAIEYMENL